MDRNLRTVFWVCLVGAVIWHALLLSPALVPLLGWFGMHIEGFYADMVLGALMLLLYPATIVAAAVISAVLVRHHRVKYFFVALALALAFNAVGWLLLRAVAGAKNAQATQTMHEADPQSRGRLDPLRPLSLVQPGPLLQAARSPIQVEVQARPGVIEDGVSQVIVVPEVPVKTQWGAATLRATGESAQNGARQIYRATLPFDAPAGWNSALLIVRGAHGEVDIAQLVP